MRNDSAPIPPTPLGNIVTVVVDNIVAVVVLSVVLCDNVLSVCIPCFQMA